MQRRTLLSLVALASSFALGSTLSGTAHAQQKIVVGGGGLGELIFTGIDTAEPAMMLAGAITTCLLAVTVDFLLYQIQFWLIPRGVNPFRPVRA